MKTRMKSTSAGFNLVEMAIALVVVAIGIVSIIGLFPSQLESVRKGNQRTHMVQLATSIVDTLRGMGAVGIDYTQNPINGIVPLEIPDGAGGRWVEPGSTNLAKINLDGKQYKIHLVDSDASNGNWINQSMWYSVTLNNLASGASAPAGVIGRKVEISLWPGDHGSASQLPSTPVGSFTTEVYHYNN